MMPIKKAIATKTLSLVKSKDYSKRPFIGRSLLIFVDKTCSILIGAGVRDSCGKQVPGEESSFLYKTKKMEAKA